MHSRELAIQMMHDHIVNDLLAVARQYESLRQSSPILWHKQVQTAMHQFLMAQQKHPPFQRFCQLYEVVPETFIAEVLKSATQQLGGTC